MTRRRKPPGLNAVGKPYSSNYNPNRKLRFAGGTKISRLHEPYGASMRFVGDQSITSKRRRRSEQPQPAPLLDLLEDGKAQ
jgi:hypothetical protein